MDAGIIDISPVRTGASLARRGVLTRYGGDNSAGGQQSGFNAIQWALSLLTHTKQQTHVLHEISTAMPKFAMPFQCFAALSWIA